MKFGRILLFILKGLVQHFLKSRIPISLFILLLIFHCTQTCAQEGGETPVEELLSLPLQDLLKLKVSTSSKRLENVFDSPGVMTVITDREIQLFGGNTIVELLERVIGVQPIFSLFVNNNATPIRGDRPSINNLHVLVLLDGKVFNQDSYSGYYNQAIFSSFPISAIQQIEIVRGPGSVLYGTNAYSGLINIITKKSGPALSMKGTIGTFGTKGIEAFSYFKALDSELNVSSTFKYFDTNGWPLFANGLYPINYPNPAQLDRLPVSGHFYQNGNLGFTSNLKYKDFQLSGFIGHTDQFNWRTPFAGSEGYLKNNKYFIDLEYNFKFNQQINLLTHVSHTAGLTDLLIRSLPTDPFESPTPVGHVRTNDTRLETTLFLKPEKNLNLLLGGLINHLNGRFQDTPFSQNFSWSIPWYGAYFQADYRFSSFFKLIAGGQFNKVPNVNINFVPRIDGIFNLTPAFGLKVLYGQAFRAPLPGESMLPAEGSSLLGNPYLVPELVNTTSLQLFYQKVQYQFSLTYYTTHQTNLIQRTPLAGQNISQFQNIDSLNLQGLEFESKVFPTTSLYLLGGMEARQSDDGKENYGVALTPVFIAKAGFGLLHKKISAGLFNSLLTPYRDNVLLNPNRALINPASSTINLLSANLSYSFTSPIKSKVSLYGTNLLDMTYYIPDFSRLLINSIPGGPGRAVYLNFEATF